jgi:hypothetical protein
MSLKFPTQEILLESIIRAVRAKGGVAKSREIDEFVITDLNLNDEIVSKIRQGSRTELQYRLAWVRTRAKNSGHLSKGDAREWRLGPKAL